MNQGIAYRVLVVDDEDRVRTSCRKVLEPQGFEVMEASDGLMGLEMIAEHNPDLVLVDLMMPKMNGMELLVSARRTHPDLAFVVITGFATLDKAVEAMKNGADDFLAKPFKPQDLRLVVQRALKQVVTLEAMALEKSRTRVLVETMHSGVLVVNAEGEVALINQSLKTALGLSESDPSGRLLEDILPAGEIRDILRQAINPQTEEPVKLNLALGQGAEPSYFTVVCAPITDRRGRVMGALAVFEDVTAWQRLDQLKNEYVSTVAHDIASPLGSVLSQLETLSRGLAGELTEKQEHLISRASLRVKGIVELSKDLLELAKMDGGKPPEPEAVDLLAVLKEAAEVAEAAAEQKNQSLVVELPDALPQLSGSQRAFSQVFNNLLSNAVRYTPEGGRIELSAQAELDAVTVSVSDNGLGIPAEDHEKIFEKFYRVKNADTRQIVGTGLGLPIVKRVLEQYGGRIELTSQLGQGSTFKVVVPLD